MALDATIAQVKRIRVDSLYGKKTHFEAARRQGHYHLWLGIGVLVLTVTTASSLFFAVTEVLPKEMFWIPLALTLVAVLLSSLQTFFHFDAQAGQHARIATRYLCAAKDASRLVALTQDGLLDEASVVTRLDQLAAVYADIARDAEAIPCTDADYKRAKASFKAGDERYTDDELEA